MTEQTSVTILTSIPSFSDKFMEWFLNDFILIGVLLFLIIVLFVVYTKSRLKYKKVRSEMIKKQEDDFRRSHKDPLEFKKGMLDE